MNKAVFGIAAVVLIAIVIVASIPQQDQDQAGENIQVKIEDAAGSKSTPPTPDEPILQQVPAPGFEDVPEMIVESSKNCSGSAGCFTGYITRIVDGDTIYTATLKIRLSLTNTPERNQQGYNEATQFTEKLCPVGSEILVDQDDLQKVDRFGRVLAKVYCGDKVLNSELLFNGHANILTQYCSTSEFSGEAWAKRYGCSF